MCNEKKLNSIVPFYVYNLKVLSPSTGSYGRAIVAPPPRRLPKDGGNGRAPAFSNRRLGDTARPSAANAATPRTFWRWNAAAAGLTERGTPSSVGGGALRTAAPVASAGARTGRGEERGGVRDLPVPASLVSPISSTPKPPACPAPAPAPATTRTPTSSIAEVVKWTAVAAELSSEALLLPWRAAPGLARRTTTDGAAVGIGGIGGTG